MPASVASSDNSTEAAPPSTDEWSLFRRAHPHALVIGASASGALERLRPHLRAPLCHWRPQAGAELPQETKPGTLVIWDVDTLDRTQQEKLLAWAESNAADVQMISIAERPLFPLVVRQEFLDSLYYRLNTVCLG